MNKIDEIIPLIRELESDISVCVNCGMCQSVCPLFMETGKEFDVARGKLNILQGVADNILDNIKRINFNIEKCLLCGSCADICPRKVDTIGIFLKTRIILKNCIGLSYTKKLLLRKTLNNPFLFDFFIKTAEKMQSILFKNEMQNTISSKIPIPFIQDRHISKIAKKQFHNSSHSKINIKPKNDKKKISFYIGCLIDNFLPNIAKSSILALKKNGFGISVPKNQVCCGMPSLASGDLKSFNALVEKNISIFKNENSDYILSACPTCTYVIKKIWKEFYVGDENIKKEIKTISKKIMDINAFFVCQLNLCASKKKKKEATLITYHDSCHLKKSLHIEIEPRILIQSNNNYEFVEMESPDKCCGMGGSFSLQFYNISKKITKKKIQLIEDSKAKIIATACPACIIQLQNFLSKTASKKLVKHTMEIFNHY